MKTFKRATLIALNSDNINDVVLYVDNDCEEVENLGDNFTADEALKAFREFLVWTYEYSMNDAEDDFLSAENAEVCKKVIAAIDNEKVSVYSSFPDDITFYVYIF